MEDDLHKLFFFKASKFIAVHFLIAFTMEIVQIFIVNSTAFERSQSLCYLLQSFTKIYIKLVLFLKFKQYYIQRDYIMLSRGEKKKKPGSHRALSVLIKHVFLTCTSLYSLTNSFNKYLLTSTFQALLRAPEGLEMERHQLSFYADYSVILETDMQNSFYNTVSCLRGGIYKRQ